MRLRLIPALAVTALALPALASPLDPAGAGATLRVYTDDDHVVVVSPSASASTTLGPSTSVAAGVAVDAVSAASVDVLSAASPVAVRELRLEVGARLARAFERGGLVVAADGLASHERDYDAIRVGAMVRSEVADRNLVLELEYRIGFDRVRDIGADPGGERSSHQLAGTLSQVLGERTVADLIVDGGVASGYHASPYRRVPVARAEWPLPTWMPEQTPARRRSLAVAARVRRALTRTWFLSASQRFYVDEWDMTSHTTTADVSWQLGARWLLGASARAYLQRGASFYRRSYTDLPEPPTLRTRDRTLGPMRSGFVSITADRPLGDGPGHIVAACGLLSIRYLDSSLQTTRHALVTTVSWNTTF